MPPLLLFLAFLSGFSFASLGWWYVLRTTLQRTADTCYREGHARGKMAGWNACVARLQAARPVNADLREKRRER